MLPRERPDTQSRIIRLYRVIKVDPSPKWYNQYREQHSHSKSNNMVSHRLCKRVILEWFGDPHLHVESARRSSSDGGIGGGFAFPFVEACLLRNSQMLSFMHR